MIKNTLSLILIGLLTLPVALAASETDEQQYRISKDKISLDIYFRYHDKAVPYNSDMPVEKRASNLTGIALRNVGANAKETSLQGFNLLIANGDIPDIVGGTQLRDKFNQYGPKGYFEPLNKLIEAHAPNIKKYFDKNPDILKAISAPDGKLYHIPYIPDGKFGRAYYIRADWLDTLGLKEPSNVDELYTVLKAFKTQDPNQNGLQDEVPLFFRQHQELSRLVTLWDGRTSGTDTWHDFYVQDGRIRHGYTEDNYKVGMSHLAKWYDEGLIDSEVYDRSGDIRGELLGSNRGGMTRDWFASTASYNNRLEGKIPDFMFKPMIPPASTSGKRIEEHRRTSVKPDGWAISTTNEHIVETIKYFDFWFTPYGRRLANFGVEGSEYNLVDGKPVFTDDVLHGDIPVNARLWSVGSQIPRGFVQDYEYERQWTNKIALAGIEMYEKGDFLLEPFHGVTLGENEQRIMDDYWAEIRTFMLERQEEWVLGLRDVNNDWASYKKRLDKLGIQKVIAAMQSAYDRQYGSPRTAELED